MARPIPTAATPTFAQVDAEQFGRSLADFIRGAAGDGSDGAWRIVEPGIDLEWTWHLDALCQHLEAVTRGDIRNLLITVPPRTLKSRIVAVFWPAWVWATMPHAKFMFGSYAEKLAVRDAVATRDILRSTWFKDRWPHVQLKLDADKKSDYRNSKGGFRYSFGVQGAATGEGGDFIVADDPINVAEAHSVAARVEASRWWTEVMPSRLNDRRTGRRVVVMQRVHEQDVAAICIAAGYVHLDLPMEFVPERKCVTKWTETVPLKSKSGKPMLKDGKALTTTVERSWSDPRKKAGESLDPVRFPADVIAQLKDVKADGLAGHAYAAQYQQDPAPIDANSIFPVERWGRWHSLPALREPDDVLTSWDFTFDGKKTAQAAAAPGQPDMVVGWLIYVYGAHWYVIDEVRGQWGYAKTKRNILSAVKKWGGQIAAPAAFDAAMMVSPVCTECAEPLGLCECPSLFPFVPMRHVVEKKANGHAILNELKPVLPGLVPWEPSGQGDKVARAWAIQPAHEAEQFWLPADDAEIGGMPLHTAWVDGPEGALIEFAKFPRGRWDDRVDTLTGAKLASAGRRRWRAA